MVGGSSYRRDTSIKNEHVVFFARTIYMIVEIHQSIWLEIHTSASWQCQLLTQTTGLLLELTV